MLNNQKQQEIGKYKSKNSKGKKDLQLGESE